MVLYYILLHYNILYYITQYLGILIPSKKLDRTKLWCSSVTFPPASSSVRSLMNLPPMEGPSVLIPTPPTPSLALVHWLFRSPWVVQAYCPISWWLLGWFRFTLWLPLGHAAMLFFWGVDGGWWWYLCRLRPVWSYCCLSRCQDCSCESSRVVSWMFVVSTRFNNCVFHPSFGQPKSNMGGTNRPTAICWPFNSWRIKMLANMRMIYYDKWPWLHVAVRNVTYLWDRVRLQFAGSNLQ